jgi:hypothetical protein
MLCGNVRSVHPSCMFVLQLVEHLSLPSVPTRSSGIRFARLSNVASALSYIIDNS